jgi:DNA ligase D-like protein (predicted 3'-phosphoesterase)
VARKVRRPVGGKRRRKPKTPKCRAAPRAPRKTRAPQREGPLFVIQKHQASRLHYDFRLEVDGVLKSWAVPKGPSVDPKDKRLAVEVEDHPLDYAGFEGVIADGEYGAGAVIVWDAGTYRQLVSADAGAPQSMAEALEGGFAEVWLRGQKVRGGYKLVRARLGGSDRNWLLIKKHDAEADARRNPVATELRSVLTGRTIGEVAAAGNARGGEDPG